MFPDLFRLSFRGGVVCDLEVVEVEHVLHLVVVPPSLANNEGDIEQEDVSVEKEKRNRWHCVISD